MIESQSLLFLFVNFFSISMLFKYIPEVNLTWVYHVALVQKIKNSLLLELARAREISKHGNIMGEEKKDELLGLSSDLI